MQKAQIKGNCKTAVAVLVIVFLGVNTAVLLSMQRKQREREERLMVELEKGRAETEKALAEQEEKIKEALAASEANIMDRMRRMEKTVIVQRQPRSGWAEENQADAKAAGKEEKLLYDEAFLEAREEEAYRLLKEGKYGAAYKGYEEVVEKDPQRLMSRYYRVYSLFYSNEMDREKYDYILEEIAYLRGVGMNEEGFKKIEACIERERGIADEGR